MRQQAELDEVCPPVEQQVKTQPNHVTRKPKAFQEHRASGKYAVHSSSLQMCREGRLGRGREMKESVQQCVHAVNYTNPLSAAWWNGLKSYLGCVTKQLIPVDKYFTYCLLVVWHHVSQILWRWATLATFSFEFSGTASWLAAGSFQHAKMRIRHRLQRAGEDN